MKKRLLLTLSILGLFLANVNAQQISGISKPLAFYKISAPTYSGGLLVPDSSFFVVNRAPLQIDTSGGTYMMVYSGCFLDSLCEKSIYNDSISNPKLFWVSDTDYNELSNPDLYDKYILTFLQGIYGDSNVTLKE